MRCSVLCMMILFLNGEAMAESNTLPSMKAITTVPEKVAKSCKHNKKARLYDACREQLTLLKEAINKAKQEKKVILVSFGADWCIWCHVFSHHVRGETKKFTYTYAGPNDPDSTSTSTIYERARRDVTTDAKALNDFVARHFVLLHVDAHFAPDGAKLIGAMGAAPHYGNWIPFIFAVGRDLMYAAHFEHKTVEKRRDGLFDWYRGYDRRKLLRELKRMHRAALQN